MDENKMTKGGRFYSVGCLPLLLVWLLLDLIGKTMIWGVASLCGKEMPGLSTVIKWMAYSIFIPLGAIFLAAVIWTLYTNISERVSQIVHKEGKDDKENKDKSSEDQKAEQDA